MTDPGFCYSLNDRFVVFVQWWKVRAKATRERGNTAM